PGGFPPMEIHGVFDDFVVKLVDGGVHDNQGIEGLVDRNWTHLIISDGSGQMPDKLEPSTRLPAVLGRIVSIYSDAEREERLLAALEHPNRTAFMHLQTGLPARSREPGDNEETQYEDPELPSAGFGVHREVQQALAKIRT